MNVHNFNTDRRNDDPWKKSCSFKANFLFLLFLSFVELTCHVYDCIYDAVLNYDY